MSTKTKAFLFVYFDAFSYSSSLLFPRLTSLFLDFWLRESVKNLSKLFFKSAVRYRGPAKKLDRPSLCIDTVARLVLDSGWCREELSEASVVDLCHSERAQTRSHRFYYTATKTRPSCPRVSKKLFSP